MPAKLVSTAVAEKMSALMTEDYLEALARQGAAEILARVRPSLVPDAPVLARFEKLARKS